MSYYSAFEIEDTSKIKIPAYFMKEFKKKAKVFKRQIKPLKKLSEDEMTVSQMKELERLQKGLKSIKVNLSDKFNVSKEENIEYEEGNYTFYWDKKNETLQLYHEEGETFDFSLEGNYFVGDGSFYSKSNYGWSKDMMEYLLSEFGGSAIFVDMGDESNGYVDEDGVDDEDELEKNQIWENGVRK